jgi:hypothetical protein
VSIRWSIDLVNWNVITSGTVVNLPANTAVYFEGIATSKSLYNSDARNNWVMSSGKRVFASGYVTALLKNNFGDDYYKSYLSAYAFIYMFYGCSSLVTPPKLANNILDGEMCYGYMFSGCSSLVAAPELPATNISASRYCYGSMFRNCSNLITTPELPATVLSSGCYSGMFSGCSSLVAAPKLAAPKLTDNCYERMFYGCTNINISEIQDEVHNASWRIPTEGNGSTGNNWNADMLVNTGGPFTSNPSVNITYYQPSAEPPADEKGLKIYDKEHGEVKIYSLNSAGQVEEMKMYNGVWELEGV